MDIIAFSTLIHAVENVGIFGVICWTIVAVARSRQRRMNSSHPTPQLTGDLQARMERLEQSAEAIALQVERIAEGQRFVTKLMTEGSGGSDKVADPRSPHT